MRINNILLHIPNHSDSGHKFNYRSNPTESLLKEIGDAYWPTWEKEVSVFPWEFVTTETALILEGEITPEDGSPSTTFKAVDLGHWK